MQGWWFIILLSCFIASNIFIQAKRRSKRFADWLGATVLKLPILGSVVHDAVIALYSRTLSTTFAAGVPLVEALESTAGAAGNAIFARAVRRIRDDVTAGTSLPTAIRTTSLFPTILLRLQRSVRNRVLWTIYWARWRITSRPLSTRPLTV